MVWIVNETIWIWQVETGVFSVAWSRRRRRNISVAERRELKQKWKTTIINTILSCAFHYRNDNNKLRNTCRLSCENVVCQCNKSKPSISIQSLLSMHVSLHCEDRVKNNKKYKYWIYTYGFGFGMSLDWSSQTGAGSLNGGCGTGRSVGSAGTIGPVFVFQSTRMHSACVTSIDINIDPTRPCCSVEEEKKTNK